METLLESLAVEWTLGMADLVRLYAFNQALIGYLFACAQIGSPICACIFRQTLAHPQPTTESVIRNPEHWARNRNQEVNP